LQPRELGRAISSWFHRTRYRSRHTRRATFGTIHAISVGFRICGVRIFRGCEMFLARCVDGQRAGHLQKPMAECFRQFCTAHLFCYRRDDLIQSHGALYKTDSAHALLSWAPVAQLDRARLRCGALTQAAIRVVRGLLRSENFISFIKKRSALLTIALTKASARRYPNKLCWLENILVMETCFRESFRVFSARSNLR
jgi:hypothetical protein